MDGIITILIKVNVLLAVLYLMYVSLFRNDTFFRWRRITLLSFYAMAALLVVTSQIHWQMPATPMAGTIDVSIATVWLQAVDVSVTKENALPDLMSIMLMIWRGVAALLALRFLWLLASIVWLVWRSKVGFADGMKVRLTTIEGSPFSFFSWIFINKKLLQESSLHEVLLHEQTHVRQCHSLDVILSELACIMFWFNPFVWLLKREVRVNLEYLADQAVLQHGNDSRSYQYHLLSLTFPRSVATLSNNFNVLPLKKRIMMMNKKRTKGISRLKYLLLLPVCALLFMMSSTPVSAQTSKSTTHPDGSVTVKYDGKDVVIKNAGEDTYIVVEEMPEFPGGMQALLNFLQENVQYPEAAKQAGLSGRVTTSFIVGEDGVCRDFKVLRSVSPELDAEALRVLGLMPKWNPGKQDGKPVPVRYTVPVVFKAQ